MEMSGKSKLKKINIAIIILICIAIFFVTIFKVSNNTEIITDPAILRAMTYTEYTDDDGHKKVYELDGTTGEETENVIENVEFSAFFLQDLDSDGIAESIAGTCNQIGSDATLYMELNVLTEGFLEDAVITINADNFYLQTALPADDEIKTNAISSNTSNIYFNTISNGTQKLITGNVRSGDYSSTSKTLAALSNNENNYSKINTVVLTGTYVAEDGTKTKISKTVEITVDWYNEPVASMPTYIAGKENLNQTQNLSTAVNEDEGTFTVKIKVGMEETESKSLLEEAYIYGEIPELNGYSATAVSITGTNVESTWDEESQEYTAKVVAETGEDGNIISNAYYGVYTSGTYYRYNYFDFEITYPIDAYYAVGSETIVYQLTANGYYMAYNNPNEEFDNPVQSNIASGTFITTIERGGGDVIAFETYVGTYRSSSPKGWVVSKENPLSIYNGYAESEDIEDTYLVTWEVTRGADGVIDGIIIAESKLGLDTKTVDYFTTSEGNQVSMEDVTTNVGIYFSYASNMFGEDGWIKVYDDETDELIVTFTNDGADDTENWNSYSSSKAYYYEESVKHIRIETSSAANSSSLYIYNVKELDDEYITTNYTEDYFDTLSYISTTLVGYATYGGDADATYIKTDVDQAYYEAPYAYASLGISESAYSTQETTESVDITITTNTSAYNQIKWTNGSFLIEIPEDIINLEINSININNSNVEITNYEQYEENGKTYIKIDTENEEEATYTITLNVNITPNPKMVTTTEAFTLYYYNENAVTYETNTTDIYDINNNLSTEDTIGQASLNVNLVAPSSLLTSESVTNYDENESETVAPNVAEVDKEQSSADINISITNNYSSTISGIVILGRVPFEGNAYTIRGKDLGSTFTVTMTGEIEIPEGLTGTVYYSTNGESTKDLDDESNGWVTADEVTDWSKIKSYLIDISDEVLNKGDSYTFTYNVNLPNGLDYNDVTYSHHAIWFNLDTENGKYATYTEPNKVGIMIAKQYDLELTKYQISTNYLVAGATYKVTDLSTGNSKTATTDKNGVLTISGLYVERTYTLQEIKSSSDYELNSDVITFTCTVDDDYNLVLQDQEGNCLNIEVVQETEDEDHKLKVEVEDEVKATVQIVKTDGENSQKLQNVKFKITGKNFANGKTISTNSEGTATLSGLTIGETYTIEETKTQDGYYLIQELIEVKVNSNNDGTYYLEIISDEENVAKVASVTYTNGIPTLTINIENESIPSYSLEITKVKENDEETYLQGARYELYSEDTGDYEYLYTGEDGTLTFEGLYNYVDGKYISGIYKLTEIIAPEGYSVNDETIEFCVELNEDGSQNLYITNEEDLATLVSYDDSSDIIKITLEDKPLFTLSKVTAEDNTVTLAGAKFIIYETNAAGDIQDYAKDVNGNYVGEQDENGDYIITTDENGEYQVGLKGGFYVAVEVEAPYGYSLAEDTYFTIEGYDTYKISTVEEFLEFAEDDSTNGLAVELTADLDFTGVDYTPKAEFNGIFIGNGHKISNLTISNSVETSSVSGSYTYIYQYAGLFAKSDGSTINGIELENLSIENNGESETKVTTNYSYLYRYIGGVVGYSTNTTIANCYITGDSNVNIADSEQEYSSGYLYYGGIVGFSSNSTTKNCYNTANINIETGDNIYSNIGGIKGYDNSGKLENCYNKGEINVETQGLTYIGGLSSYGSSMTIENCYNMGNISAIIKDCNNSYVAGICGYMSSCTINKSYNTGNIDAESEDKVQVGGIGAWDSGGEILDCYNIGSINVYMYKITGNPGIGGIVGYNTSTKKIENCYNKGDVILVIDNNNSDNGYYVNSVGGISGFNQACNILNCYNEGNISLSGDAVYAGSAGGVVGYVSNSACLIEKCYNIGNISTPLNSSDSGGIVGGIFSSSSVSIVNCYNEGTINSGSSYTGGIIGQVYNCTSGAIYNCYNKGDIVTTKGYLGGVIGRLTGAINGCNLYNTGNLSGTNIGGVVGRIDTDYGESILNYVYYEDSVSKGVYSGTDTATSMTFEEMQETDFVALLNENQSSIETEYELLEWVSSETYPVFGTDLSFELDINVTITEETVEDTVTEITVKDELKTYKITTEVAENSSGSRTGGTITGNRAQGYANYITYVETVTHGEDALTDIVITPSDGYEVISITLDGEEIEYEVAEDGTVTLPALENVTADHHYIVTFDKAENQIVINKKDSSTGEALEGVTFQIDQIEDRDELTEEEKDEIIGDMTDNSLCNQAVVNKDEDITNEVLGKLTSAGTYYFEENENGRYSSNNSGVSSVYANSYLTIDLTDYEGTYAVVVNGEVSGNGYGYATITSSNSSAPYYYNSTGRFMYINGTTNSADYTSSILEGGNIYYLYLGFYSTSTSDSQAIINSIKIYSAEEEDCVFVENEDGSYSSNNHSDYSYSDSYIEIDLTDYSGMYNLTVNAEISTGSSSYGYAVITQSLDDSWRWPYLINITGEQEATDYTYELEGGAIYYLQFEYYIGYESYNIETDDTFTINSVDLEISDSDFLSGTYTTDENGQIIAYLHDGTYTATEISGLDGYDELEEPITFTFRTENKSVANDSSIAYYDEETGEYTIYNKQVGNILVHHVLVDSSGNIVYDEDGNPTYVAEDETSYGSDGATYTTSPQMDLTEYTLATNGDLSEETINELKETGYITSDELDDEEYYIPSNSYGAYISGETIEITYYYVAKEVPITVYHYIEGTTIPVPTSSDDVETTVSQVGTEGEEYETTSLTEDELAEKYELVETPVNATGVYSYSEIIVTYYYTIVSRDLKVVKTDENGNSLSGVTFTITGIDEDTEGYEESFITSSSGIITTTLEYGTYIVQETGTLEGYDLDETIYTIKITKEGISLITYDEEGEEVSELLTLNDEGEYELEIENTITKGNVIVHHYIYDETQENPYTEIQVPSSSGGTVEDESTSGIVGDIYATKESEDVAENYEYVTSTDNTSGEYIDGTIEVIYYYKEKEEAEVIVHHYLYDESLGGYTECQVAEDEEITGYVGKEYETESSETAKETYEVISETPENYEGNMTEEIIEVIYYYKLPEQELENGITKTAQIEEDETLTDEEIKVAYNISYEVSIENYSGIATITIVDTLPYAIDEELSNIDGGKYEVSTDEEGNATYTITWTEDITVEENYTGTIEKEIKVVYEDIDVTTSIKNVVDGTVTTYYPDTYPVEEYQGKVKDQVEAEDTAEVEPKYTVKETAIEKTGTEVINALTDEVTYTINYTAIITDYEGDMLLTITDNLPYSINEELSELDEGVYNFDDNTNTATITWQETIEDVNTDENGDYEIKFSKTITVVYGEDLQLTQGTITNNVIGMLELYETDQTYTVEDSYGTEIKIPSTVIVKYVDIDTGEEIEEEETIEGYVGDEYETEEKQIEDYTFEEATENTEGEMTEDTIYVIYYYSKNEEEEPNNTNEENINTNDTNSVDENEPNTNNIYANETNQNSTNDVVANNENTNNTSTSSSTGKTDPEENTAKTDPEENTSNTDTTLPGTGGQGVSTIIKIGVLIIIIGFIVSKVKIIKIDENSNK